MEFLLVTYDTSDYYWQNNTPMHNPDEFWFRYYESDTNVPIDTSKCDKRESDRAKLEDIERKLEQNAKNAERMTMYRLLAKDNPEFSALLTEYETLKSQTEGSYE